MWFVNQAARSPFHSQVGRSSIPALDMDASCSQVPQTVHRLAIIFTLVLCVWGWCISDESFPPLGHVESILTCNIQICASTSHLALPHRFSGFESWEHVSTHRYASFSNIQELLLLGANQCHEWELLTFVNMTNWWPVFSYNSFPKKIYILLNKINPTIESWSSLVREIQYHPYGEGDVLLCEFHSQGNDHTCYCCLCSGFARADITVIVKVILWTSPTIPWWYIPFEIVNVVETKIAQDTMHIIFHYNLETACRVWYSIA
jgi:hypothetical protein